VDIKEETTCIGDCYRIIVKGEIQQQAVNGENQYKRIHFEDSENTL